MKINVLFISLALLGATFITSCTKDDKDVNLEADIISAAIDADSLLQTNPVIGDKEVVFKLKSYTDDFHFAPTFELSPGATIDPASGTERDFTHSQKYTVTSEDGNWTKDYKVSFIVDSTVLEYSFENVDTTEQNFEEFIHLTDQGDTSKVWASGNIGYSLLFGFGSVTVDQIPSNYPTAQALEGFVGKGVKLVTRSTGSLGGAFGSPLAAGNLFLGNFDKGPALTDPLSTTQFGQPYTQSGPPIALEGYFKYQKGDSLEVHADEGSTLTEDAWDAYAVLFEKKDGEPDYLTAHNIFEDDRIVSLAKLDDSQRIEADEWTQFYIPFENVDGKTFDPDKEYIYTIVFTSSKEGNIFNGAVGSTLYVDEVKLIVQK